MIRIRQALKEKWPHLKFSVRKGITVRYPGNQILKVAPNLWDNTNAPSTENRLVTALVISAAGPDYSGRIFVGRW